VVKESAVVFEIANGWLGLTSVSRGIGLRESISKLEGLEICNGVRLGFSNGSYECIRGTLGLGAGFTDAVTECLSIGFGFTLDFGARLADTMAEGLGLWLGECVSYSFSRTLDLGTWLANTMAEGFGIGCAFHISNYMDESMMMTVTLLTNWVGLSNCCSTGRGCQDDGT
jgi:hypothetical protein